MDREIQCGLCEVGGRSSGSFDEIVQASYGDRPGTMWPQEKSEIWTQGGGHVDLVFSINTGTPIEPRHPPHYNHLHSGDPTVVALIVGDPGP